MKLLDYIKDKLESIILYLFNMILIVTILYIFKVYSGVIILIFGLELLLGIGLILINYYKKANFYNELINNIKSLDKKYLILETLKEPETLEEKIMFNIMHETNKSMIETIKEFENNIIDFKEFIEIWIHEVKIPISSLVLKCHNNKSKYSNDFLNIVRKLDNYVDQILYYIRSEETEKDFVISDVDLKSVIKNVALKNKDDLLENNIELKVNMNKICVSTDSKWLEYIINQIINNSIKYKKTKDSIIEINGVEENNKVILSIYDNGIGIPKKDIKNVCKKTFTGSNGRSKTKSTGMGLYIVNNLLNKLGHVMQIESEENKYTKVSIIFDKNDYYKMGE